MRENLDKMNMEINWNVDKGKLVKRQGRKAMGLIVKKFY